MRAIDSSRIVAVDAARGLAVVGMIAVHTLTLTYDDTLSWSNPSSWHTIAYGRSSILFAVLGGVSLALMTGRTTPPTGTDLMAARLRVLVRACLLFLIGGILSAVAQDRAAVILEYYAVMFALAVPMLSWRPRRLLIAAGAWAVVSPILVWWLSDVLPPQANWASIVLLGVTGTYPALIWISFVLLGLAIGRADVTVARTRARLVRWGGASALVGYGVSWVACRLFLAEQDPHGVESPLREPKSDSGESTSATDDSGYDQLPGPGLTSLLTADPHTGTLFEVLGSAGLAAAVLGLLLYCTPSTLRILAPLIAIGCLPLTVYTGHILSLTFLGRGTTFFVASAAIAVIAALTWTRNIGRGPLEYLVSRVSHAAADPKDPTPREETGITAG